MQPLELVVALLLGVVQGISEWFPISSSAHLLIVQELLGMQGSLGVAFSLHLGTLAAVATYYREKIGSLLADLTTHGLRGERGDALMSLLVATVVSGVAGVPLWLTLPAGENALTLSAAGLLATGMVLLYTRRRGGPNSIGTLTSILVGLAQGISIIPGVSRSGATIATALAMDAEREESVDFSFLLSIPPIAALSILELAALWGSGAAVLPLMAGLVVSFAVGYLSLRIVKHMVVNEGFHHFGYYCVVLAVVVGAYSYALLPL